MADFGTATLRVGSCRLAALATANPSLYVSQAEAYAYYAGRFDLAPADQALYRRLLLDGPVKGRYIGMDSTGEAAETDPDKLNARYLRHARRIAVKAARRALNRSGFVPAEIGGLVVNTCTGYLCPGLSSYLAEDLGLESDLRVMDLVGMGCGAALPNLECAAGLLLIDGARPVLSIAVEICSATLFMGSDPGLIVSNCIFGDGAAAAVLTSGQAPQSGGTAAATMLGFSSVLQPKHREQLRYRQVNGRLRNHLTVKVPVIGANLAEQALLKLLGQHRLNRSDIRWWAIHPGGTAVLDQVGKKLGLEADDLRFSESVFRSYGNMSSPSVLFALDNILRDGNPEPGDLGVLLAFGAGFSAFAALVEFGGTPL